MSLSPVMLRMEDLEKFIWKRERAPYSCRDWKSFGREVSGSVRKKMRSFAKAATLCDPEAFRKSAMPKSARIVHRKGSRVSIKIKGDRGQPCDVPLRMLKKVGFHLIDLDRGRGVGVEGYYPAQHGGPECNMFQGGLHEGPVYPVELSLCPWIAREAVGSMIWLHESSSLPEWCYHVAHARAQNPLDLYK